VGAHHVVAVALHEPDPQQPGIVDCQVVVPVIPPARPGGGHRTACECSVTAQGSIRMQHGTL